MLVCAHILLPSNYVQASQVMLQCKFLITTGNNSVTQTLVTEFHMVLCWLHYSTLYMLPLGSVFNISIEISICVSHKLVKNLQCCTKLIDSKCL